MKQLIIIFLFICGFLNAQVKDTVIIIDSVDSDIRFPQRVCFFKKRGGKPAIDSITSAGIAINKYMQNYYLIVINKKGEKLMEGDFFDEFACGKIIEYKTPGKKSLEGSFIMTRFERKECGVIKEYTSDPTGTWNYYGPTGILVRTMTYDPLKKTTAIKNYNAKGKIISEEFLKDGKPVKK
jgi:hypothetical protein